MVQGYEVWMFILMEFSDVLSKYGVSCVDSGVCAIQSGGSNYYFFVIDFFTDSSGNSVFAKPPICFQANRLSL